LTPAEYHKQLRLEKFRELLESTNLTVSQILGELNIEDGSISSETSGEPLA
jgi:transcriptional regulator GlxA family with amidase domain